jgi:hypothetical protein
MINFKSTANDVFMAHIDDTVKALVDKSKATGEPISFAVYQTMYLNLYEQKYVEPYLSDEALVWKIDNALKNVAMRSTEHSVPLTYDEYIATDGITELLKRFKKSKE